MAVTFTGLTNADFSVLEAAGIRWATYAEAIEEQATAIEDILANQLSEENWDSDTAEEAKETAKAQITDLGERAHQARLVSADIADAHTTLKECLSDLADIVAEAPGLGVSVTAEGSVFARPPADPAGDPNNHAHTDNAATVESRISSVLEAATEADAALHAGVASHADTMSLAEQDWLDRTATGPAEEFQELLDNGASPEQINDWWNSLSDLDQTALTESRPDLIGPVDGIPTDTRDEANRTLLDQEIDSFSPTLDEDIAALEAQLAEWDEAYERGEAVGEPGETSSYQSVKDRLDDLIAQRDRRDDLTDLQERIAEPSELTGQDHYLLDYDSAGDGQAIVALGNPDTADNTAVYVPGTGADLNGAGHGLMDRVDAMARDASQVPGSGETAVVMWLGYDAPDHPAWDAPKESYAEDAAAPLSSFTGGLEATNHNPAETTTTVMGHSYGTTVIGHAASEHGLATDQIVSVASPGMGVDHASELGIDPDDFYATTAPHDIINLPADSSLVLGPDPTETGTQFGPGLLDINDDGFGGNTFTSDNMDGNPIEIHSNYWDEGNAARENMRLIFTGNGDQVS